MSYMGKKNEKRKNKNKRNSFKKLNENGKKRFNYSIKSESHNLKDKELRDQEDEKNLELKETDDNDTGENDNESLENTSKILNEKTSGEELINKNIYEILKKENENLKAEIKSKDSDYEIKIKKQKIEYEESLKRKTNQIKVKEEENSKLKTDLEETNKTYNNLKCQINAKEKIIQELQNQKRQQDYQSMQNECEIKNLKNCLQKEVDELNKIKKEHNLFVEEIGRLKAKIEGLEIEKLNLEKSLENEKKKNIHYSISIKNKEEKILFFKNKLSAIKDVVFDIGNEIEDKYRNKNMSIESKEEDEKGEEEEEEDEEEEEEIEFDNNLNNGKVGIDNEELNCYMSSVIQVLKNIKAFSLLILKANKKDDDILLSFKNLLKSLYYSKQQSVSLVEFKTYFSRKYKVFEGKKDNDSTFFLLYLFQYLQNNLRKPKRKVTNLNEFSFLKLKTQEKQELVKFLNTYEPKYYSALHDLFFGYQMSEIICSGCNKLEISFQSFNILHLSLYDGNTKLTSLEQCINSFLYTKDKKGSDNFKCSKCHRKCLSHVISLVKLPPILIINLKRVGERSIYNHDIQIPIILKTSNIEKLEKFNMEYELIGFIKHFGSENSGHNVAYTKNIFDNNWYCFDDNKVAKIVKYLSTNNSFLLFYQLKNK